MDTRIIRSKDAAEAYITAVPRANLPVEEQARELFSGIKDALKAQNLRLMQERVFGTQDALRIAQPIRAQVYGPLDDGLEPSWLLVPAGIAGQIAGVQIHAIGPDRSPELLRLDQTPCGRIFRQPGRGGYMTLSNILAPDLAEPVKQARLVFEKAESVLKQVNADMFLVPRTWMWLADILSWYDDFNAVRNQFFIERGLITKDSSNRMPASTGIGIGPLQLPSGRADNGAVCGMALTAVLEPKRPIEYLDAAGNQSSALDYGSAFSRASRAETPAGTTVYISGTASIDADGKTVYLDDAQAQIETTIKNLRAVLRQMNCRDEHVVQAIAYCKTPEVEKLFHDKWADLSWPNMTAIADVCRPELLFEMELIAAFAAE
jgi:enamine deaminase RidA (YjgF/YER057c/UK114 family)